MYVEHVPHRPVHMNVDNTSLLVHIHLHLGVMCMQIHVCHTCMLFIYAHVDDASCLKYALSDSYWYM